MIIIFKRFSQYLNNVNLCVVRWKNNEWIYEGEEHQFCSILLHILIKFCCCRCCFSWYTLHVNMLFLPMFQYMLNWRMQSRAFNNIRFSRKNPINLYFVRFWIFIIFQCLCTRAVLYLFDLKNGWSYARPIYTHYIHHRHKYCEVKTEKFSLFSEQSFFLQSLTS